MDRASGEGRHHEQHPQLKCARAPQDGGKAEDLRVPFGGMKESGVGREGGFDSLAFFTEAKNVCIKL